MFKYYKEGKLSLTALAKKLDVSISEALDLLKERGIEAPLGFDDYLKGFEVFNQVK
jgi:predicted HTH domain antitoxin